MSDPSCTLLRSSRIDLPTSFTPTHDSLCTPSIFLGLNFKSNWCFPFRFYFFVEKNLVCSCCSSIFHSMYLCFFDVLCTLGCFIAMAGTHSLFDCCGLKPNWIRCDILNEAPLRWYLFRTIYLRLWLPSPINWWSWVWHVQRIFWSSRGKSVFPWNFCFWWYFWGRFWFWIDGEFWVSSWVRVRRIFFCLMRVGPESRKRGT